MENMKLKYEHCRKDHGQLNMGHLMRTGVVSLLILFQGHLLLAQGEPEDWTLIAAQEGVSISYRVSECSGLRQLLLMVANEGENTADVTWNINIIDGAGHEAQFAGSATGISSNERRSANCETAVPTPLLIYLEHEVTALGISGSISVVNK